MFKCVLLIMIFAGNAEKRQIDTFIKWSDTTQLNYADFKGAQAPPKDSVARPDTLAVINCAIKYEIDISTGRTLIHAYAVMHPEHSWMKVRTPSVLQHEQGHFDIEEIYARRFEKMMNDTLIKDADNYFIFLTDSFKQILADVKEEHNKYDNWTMNNLGKDFYYKWIHDQLYPSDKPGAVAKPSPL